MDFPSLRELAAGNPWPAIWPELSLGCLALLLLVLETVLPRAARKGIPAVSILGQLGILAVLLANFDTAYRETFNGLLMQSPSGQVMRVFFQAIPYMILLLVLLAAITYVPQLSLFLPNLVMGSPPLPRPFRGDYAEFALTFRQR